MKKIENAVRDMWVGYHPKLGALIYDTGAQLNVGENEVRLFKIKERESSLFVKSILRNKLVEPDPEVQSYIEDGVTLYVALLGRRRITHCFNCMQHLDSVDFSICDKCKWIKCGCSACGCSYSRHHHESAY